MILKLKHHFDAAHKLYNKNWSAKKNKQIYGACNNQHGHRWNVEVKIDGEQNEKGWIVNFKDVKEVINKFDHNYINDIIKVIPTAENIASILLDEIDNLGKFNMVEVTVYETPDCSITVNSLRGD
jgi:6-pyruvoyltetrahydropterin/6-carboxytetrahydropterin synthase